MKSYFISLIIPVAFAAFVCCIPTNPGTGHLFDVAHSAAASSSFSRRTDTALNPFPLVVPNGSSIAISGIANADDFTVRATVTLAPAFGPPVVFQGAGVDIPMAITDEDGNPTNTTCFTSPAQDFNHTIFLFFEFSVDGQQPFETAVLRPPTGEHVLRFESEAEAKNDDNEVQFFVTLLPGPPDGC